MTNAVLEGFITRKLAAEPFDISDRSLGRYLKKAMIRGDAAFLSHFQLRTLDEETIDGANVTLEFIDQLQAEGRVPS